MWLCELSVLETSQLLNMYGAISISTYHGLVYFTVRYLQLLLSFGIIIKNIRRVAHFPGCEASAEQVLSFCAKTGFTSAQFIPMTKQPAPPDKTQSRLTKQCCFHKHTQPPENTGSFSKKNQSQTAQTQNTSLSF